MSKPRDPSTPVEPSDMRIQLLRRALELSGVEHLVAASLAHEHYGRITVRGRRFEVTDPEGQSQDGRKPDEDAIMHLAEQIKQSIPAKFLTDDALERERADETT